MDWYMRAHSACFLQFVPVLCMTMASNYVEGWKSANPALSPTPLAWTILGIYIFATCLETFFASYAIFTYEGMYEHANRELFFQIDPRIMQAVDYCWFLSLPLAASFQPMAPNLRFSYQLEDCSTYGAVPQEDECSDWEAQPLTGTRE